MRAAPRSLLVLLAATALAACDKAPSSTASAPNADPSAGLAEAAAWAGAEGHGAAPAAAAGGLPGTVEEVLAAGTYAYVRVKTADGDVWAAVPAGDYAIGGKVVVPTNMPMKGFHSEQLNRDFELVYFGESLGGAAPAKAGALPSGHPSVDEGATAEALATQAAGQPTQGAATSAATPAPGSGEKATVAAVFAGSKGLSGKTVTLKGEVVKFTGGVMGKNWVHLKDGTGAAGTDDLTITTQSTAAIGDKVQVTGIVATNQEFGYGYSYPVMLTDAVVVKE